MLLIKDCNLGGLCALPFLVREFIERHGNFPFTRAFLDRSRG